MELNFGNLPFNKAFNSAVTICLVLCPSFVFLAIYDISIFQKFDTLKIVLLGFTLSSFTYVMDYCVYAVYITVSNEIDLAKNQTKKDDEDGDNEFINGLASIAYTLSWGITISNLIKLKYFDNVIKIAWLTASIETWLLVQMIVFACFVVLLIGAYIYHKSKKP